VWFVSLTRARHFQLLYFHIFCGDWNLFFETIHISSRERNTGRENIRGGANVCRFYQRSPARFVPSVAIATVIMHTFRLWSLYSGTGSICTISNSVWSPLLPDFHLSLISLSSLHLSLISSSVWLYCQISTQVWFHCLISNSFWSLPLPDFHQSLILLSDIHHSLLSPSDFTIIQPSPISSFPISNPVWSHPFWFPTQSDLILSDFQLSLISFFLISNPVWSHPFRFPTQSDLILSDL